LLIREAAAFHVLVLSLGQNELQTGLSQRGNVKRIGQKNGIVRQWARRGTRPRQPANQRYQSAYLSGAICPARGVGAALALPFADTEAMQLHVDEISRHVEKGAHAVLVMDRAGWHTTANLRMPKNITPIFQPSRAPELALEPRLRQLRRHHRCRLRGLAEIARRSPSHHIDRGAQMGTRRSNVMTLGIIGPDPREVAVDADAASALP
ncbi:DDE superfamily endonuclease, partial [Pseudaminobacter salicylatoxidans]